MAAQSTQQPSGQRNPQPIRQLMIYLRKRYYNDRQKFIGLVAGVGAAALLVAVLIDIFLPFRGAWNIIRAVTLVPLSGSIFCGLYMLGLWMHDQRVDETMGEWVPFRLRYSLMWRRRMALIITAILVVMMYATGHTPVYTLLSAIYISIVISLFAFIRPTSEEKFREELEVPDGRDLEVAELLSPDIKIGRRKKKDKS